MYRKAIGPVIVTALMIIITVFSIVAAQTWVSSYQSTLYSKIEVEGTNTIKIDKIEKNKLYIKNEGEVKINKVKVDGNDCLVNEVYTEKIIELDLSYCLSKIQTVGTYDVVVYTDNGVYSNSNYFDTIEYNFDILIPNFPKELEIKNSGNQYHVDYDVGDNSNDGSISNPLKTVEEGLNRINSGDTLIIHESSVPYNFPFTIFDKKGTKDNWIIIKGADNENVYIEGYKGRLTFNDTSEYILFENLNLNLESRTMLRINTGSSNIVLNNINIDCDFYDESANGIQIDDNVKNLWFKNILIENCGYKKVNPTDGSGIYFSDVTSSGVEGKENLVFVNVTVKNNKGDGIGGNKYTPISLYFDNFVSIDNTGDGIDLGSSKEVIVKNSFISNNGGDQGVGLKIWGKNAWVYNNVIEDNLYSGIHLKSLFEGSKYYIFHNTIVGNGENEPSGSQITNVAYHQGGTVLLKDNVVFLYNNIIHSINSNSIEFHNTLRQGLNEDYNYFFSNNDVINAIELREELTLIKEYKFSELKDKTWYNLENQGENSFTMISTLDLISDPGYLNINGKAFSLKSDSLAINSGIKNSNINYDYDYDLRDSKPDIGAYEYN